MRLLDPDQWIECFIALRSHGLRTALTAFGVFWGIFMLVVMLGFTAGLDSAMREEFSQLEQNAFFVRATPTMRAYAGYSPGRMIELSLSDIKLLASLPGVRAVGGRLQAELVASYAERSKRVNVVGSIIGAVDIEHDTIVIGRGLNRRDSNERRKVAVIGHDVAKSLFSTTQDVIGRDMRIGGTMVRIIGVSRSAGNDATARYKNARIVMPYTTLASLYPRLPLATIIVIMADRVSSASTLEHAREQLKRWHGISPADLGGVSFSDKARRYREVQGVLHGMVVFAWVIGGLSLLTGAFGVSNITLVSIAQRTREFGVRRAVGASALDLATQVALEALVLCAGTGYFGFVAALSVLNLSRDLLSRESVVRKLEYLITPQIDLTIAAVACLVLVAAGAVACIAPARRAVALRPTECLADE